MQPDLPTSYLPSHACANTVCKIADQGCDVKSLESLNTKGQTLFTAISLFVGLSRHGWHACEVHSGVSKEMGIRIHKLNQHVLSMQQRVE